jgi:hypothetical protein
MKAIITGNLSTTAMEGYGDMQAKGDQMSRYYG